MPAAPSGHVTFLFTDVEGSTALWDHHPDAMEDALAEHDRHIRAVADAHDGYVFTTAGDSFAIAFPTAIDAVWSALEIQHGLSGRVGGLELKVRMGVHSGIATLRDGDYFGGAVNRAARVSAAAHGGQMILTEPVAKTVAALLPPDTELLDLGTHRLRGLVEPERLHQLCHPDLPQDFPRLRTVEGPGDTLPAQLTSFVGREREVVDVVPCRVPTRWRGSPVGDLDRRRPHGGRHHPESWSGLRPSSSANSVSDQAFRHARVSTLGHHSTHSWPSGTGRPKK